LNRTEAEKQSCQKLLSPQLGNCCGQNKKRQSHHAKLQLSIGLTLILENLPDGTTPSEMLEWTGKGFEKDGSSCKPLSEGTYSLNLLRYDL
ncbi:hypothetical protein EAY46_24490, partial [Vibrio anguillarum]|nr:hypothetical protein [Vibrio anguillarum]